MEAASSPDHPPLSREDWVFLNPNDRVCIQWDSDIVSYGTVDVVAPDASIFWIWLDSGLGRVALHEHDNVSVWFEEERPWLSSGRMQPDYDLNAAALTGIADET